MTLSVWRGWTALVLALGVLGGGPGAPVFDAVIYHSGETQQPISPVHVQAQGARLGHADTCSLGWIRAQPPAAPTIGQVLARLTPGDRHSTLQVGARSAIASFRSRFSRAPPSPSA